MKIITAFLILISFNLYPQWALWANPSLPVGSADNGIGLWAGQIMVSSNYNYQFIDWSHGPVAGEPFEHIGTLYTHLITPTIPLGLSDYINISYTQAIGVRGMGWGLEHSAHHRNEYSTKDFLERKHFHTFNQKVFSQSNAEKFVSNQKELFN